MSDQHIDVATNSISKSIASDVYVTAKKWFFRLDPKNDKLQAYREGIDNSLSNIQIMGMDNPKKLRQLYIAIRTLPILRNMQTLNQENIYKGRGTVDLAQKLVKFRNEKHFDEVIRDIGYKDILGDENYLAKKDVSLAKKYDDKVEKLANSETLIHKTKHGLNALEIVRDNDNIVVLGQPGCGKTTFLKYLALAYAGFAPVPFETEPLLPIFVPLRELKRVGDPKPTAEWLLDFVLSCASEISGKSFNLEWLINYLEKKHCLILLDGIDEIDPEFIGTVMQSIIAFTKKYRGNKYVTTCRSSVFDYLAEGFILCEIDNFNESDISVFIDQWFDADQEKKNDLMMHIRESKAARDLCKTPLLLTMVCILYEYNQSIPCNRSELYQTCVDALFFRWDSFRYIKRPSLTQGLSTSRKKMILARIARRTFDNDVYFFKKDTLLEMLKVELERSNLKNVSPESLLKELETHNGLFVERGVNIYSFSHLTFQEFFTALAYHEDNAHLKLLGKALSESRYREVFLMALEKMYNPDEICLRFAAYIKNDVINENKTSEYLQQLTSGILKGDIPLDPKIKLLLKAVRGDLFISDVKGKM